MNNTSTPTRTTSYQSIDIALLPAYVIVVIFGVIGNSIVIMVVKKKRVSHTTTNYLLANLAVADLNTLVWCIPGVAMKFVRSPAASSREYLCRFVSMHHMAGISLFASGLLLTLLSIERYNALLHPMNSRLRLTRGTTKYPIVLSWVLSVVFVTPLLIYQSYDDQISSCVIVWPSDAATLAYWSVLAVLVSACFLVVCFCYFSIIRELYFGNKTGDNTGTISQDKLAKRKIIKLSLTVTVVFSLSFLPFAVCSASMVATNSIVYAVSYFLVFCGTSLNPICYAFQSSNYRSAFRGTLRWSRPEPATAGVERSLRVQALVELKDKDS